MKLDHATQPDDLSWDPYDYALHADSQPVWRRMREEAPLYRNDEFDFWALTGALRRRLGSAGRLPDLQLGPG